MQITNIIPNSGPLSSLVEFTGYRLSSNPDNIDSVFLGSSVCETRDNEDNTLYGLAYRYVRCQSTEKRAGPWNGTVVLKGSSGRTWNHSQSLYPMHDWSLAMYDLFPGIHSSYCNIAQSNPHCVKFCS